MSAVNKVFGFPDYPAGEPTCIAINIKSFRDMESVLSQEKKMCDMAAYIYRPEALAQLKFSEFFAKYHYQKPKPTNDGEWYEIIVPHLSKPVYIVRWIRNPDRLCRIIMLFPQIGELFYLRVIMRARPIISEKDAKSFNGVVYTSYQLAAKAAGLLDDVNEAEMVFTEAMLSNGYTPPKLRAMFILLTAEGWPTLGLLKVENNITTMTNDFTSTTTDGTEKYRLMLMDFKKLLARHSKTLEDFNLDKDPITGKTITLTVPTELENARRRINTGESQQQYDELNTKYPNNAEQQQFIDAYKVGISHHPSLLFLLSTHILILSTFLSTSLLYIDNVR